MAAKVPSNQMKPLDISVDKPRRRRSKAKRSTGKNRVTIPLVQNLQLTSRQKFRFGLACPGLARPKRNFCLEVNWRFGTSGMVTLYLKLGENNLIGCSELIYIITSY